LAIKNRAGLGHFEDGFLSTSLQFHQAVENLDLWREAAARLLEVDPAFTISVWIALGGQTNAKLLIEGLRKAGLPE
jgi:hypothetical protein